MNKKYLVWIIIALLFLFFWLSNKDRLLDYDDYKEMELLSKKSHIELGKEGYSELDIEKIERFSVNYKNHLKLLDIVENDNIENYGYNNRSLDNKTKSDIVYDENHYTIQDSGLSYTTTIMDLIGDKGRDAGRIVIEFEWGTIPHTQNQYINVEYPKYIPANIYTLLKYKKPDDEYDVVYKMCELKPYNFIDVFFADIATEKTINQQNYILSSGTIVLDVESTIKGIGIMPLSVTSKYVGKSLFGKEKVLSEQKIVNAEQISNPIINENLIELTKYDEITLYANSPAEEGIYKGITVKIKDKKVNFPWYNERESALRITPSEYGGFIRDNWNGKSFRGY